MSTSSQVINQHADYALERTPREYERLRAQARIWQPATERLLDQIGLAPGATCLDAGCGPGEPMHLMARRVGPDGAVTGIDADSTLGPLVETSLHQSGHRHCRFRAVTLTGDTPVPGAPYDLGFARLLLFHLPQRVPVLRRLWDAVAPGGHLVVQDYDLHALEVVPSLSSVDEIGRVLVAAFESLGCDIRAGARLPHLFAVSGTGAPDGTDIAPAGSSRWRPGTRCSSRRTAVCFRSRSRATSPMSGTPPPRSRRCDETPRASPTTPWLVGAWRQKKTGNT